MHIDNRGLLWTGTAHGLNRYDGYSIKTYYNYNNDRENAAINIQQEREKGEFISKEELRKRTKISKTVIETLSNHGSLKNMSDRNQLSLF